MTTKRTAAVLRGTASTFFLAALLVLPPLALWTLVGWPLPTSIPSLEGIQAAARTGVSDEFIVGALATLAWLAWGQIALAVVVEAAAAARRRPSIRLPITPGLQAGVGRLVASIAMMISTLSPTVAAASPPPTPVPVVAAIDTTEIVEPTPKPDTPAQATARPATPTAEAAAPTVTVERHDSYWEIAERDLGDGHRWREIRDLNVGRTMATGHVIQPGSDIVHTGWVLELPTDAITATAADPQPQPAEPPSLDEVTVVDGDNFWAIAETQLTTEGHQPSAAEIAPYWRDLIEANRDRLVEPDNPDLILPGQRLCIPSEPDAAVSGGPPPTTSEAAHTRTSEPEEMAEPEPAAPAPEPASAEPVPAPVDTSPRATSPGEPHQPGEREEDESGTSPVPIALAGFASTALAVGITQAIRRRRRVEAHQTPDSPPRRTSEADRQVHGELIARADGVAVEDLRGCLGRLAQSVAASHIDARPRLVQHGPDCLDIMLAQPHSDPPRGWTADGSIWSLTEGADEPERAGADFCAAPLLVTLGQPDEGGQLYLDLEAEGLVSLAGDPDVAVNVARAIVTELAFSPMADTVQVIAIGDLVPVDATGNGHVRVASSWDEVADHVLAWAEQTNTAIEANGWPSTFVGRGHFPYHDALTALAVIAGEPPPENVTDKLRALRPASLAVVAVGDLVGATCIECTQDAIHVPDIGLTCAPYELDRDDLEALLRLLDGVDPDDEADEPAHEPEHQSSNGDTPPLARAEAETTQMAETPDPPRAEQSPGAQDGIADTTGEAPLLSLVMGTADEVHPEDEASPETEPEPETKPEPTSEAVDQQAEAEVDSASTDEHDVLVRVLGNIGVESPEPLTVRQTALITYIALHGEVSSDRIENALWTTPGSHRKALTNTISQCRNAIGKRLLPSAVDGRYRSAPGLVTDIELFERKVKTAAGQPAADVVDTLRSALDLVAGPVFGYSHPERNAYAWVDIENWVSRWELKIAATAERCADLLLELERPEDAVAVAERALEVMPTHSALTEVLMRAHAARGDRNSLMRVFTAHIGGLESLDLDDPDESTNALCEELTRSISG